MYTFPFLSAFKPFGYYFNAKCSRILFCSEIPTNAEEEKNDGDDDEAEESTKKLKNTDRINSLCN